MTPPKQAEPVGYVKRDVLDWLHSISGGGTAYAQTKVYKKPNGDCNVAVYATPQADAALMREALEALESVSPHTDKLICYASTAAEHPANLIDGKVHAAIAALRARLDNKGD